MFTLVQLECFIAVAEELHFSAAATRLQMTQPPLSRQIQQLERELSTPLFERTSRRVALTQAGRALLPNARRLLDLAAKTSAEARSVGEGAIGTITIAYTAMAGQSVVPDLLRRASAELPGVAFLLRELVSLDQLEELEKGTVDVGLMRPLPGRPQISRQRVFRERLAVAVSRDSSLAQRDHPLHLVDLDDERLLMYSPSGSRYFHDLLSSMFISGGVHPHIVQYAEQVPALLALVSAGLGFTLVPESAARIAPDTVVLLPISDDDPSSRVNRVDLDIAWNAESHSPLISRLLSLVGDDRHEVASGS